MNSILNLGKRRVSVGKQQAQTSSSDESLKDLAQGSLSKLRYIYIYIYIYISTLYSCNTSHFVCNTCLTLLISSSFGDSISKHTRRVSSGKASPSSVLSQPNKDQGLSDRDAIRIKLEGGKQHTELIHAFGEQSLQLGSGRCKWYVCVYVWLMKYDLSSISPVYL